MTSTRFRLRRRGVVAPCRSRSTGRFVKAGVRAGEERHPCAALDPRRRLSTSCTCIARDAVACPLIALFNARGPDRRASTPQNPRSRGVMAIVAGRRLQVQSEKLKRPYACVARGARKTMWNISSAMPVLSNVCHVRRFAGPGPMPGWPGGPTVRSAFRIRRPVGRDAQKGSDRAVESFERGADGKSKSAPARRRDRV